MAVNNYLTVDVINLCVTILELVKYIYYYEMLNVLQENWFIKTNSYVDYRVSLDMLSKP